MTCIVGYKNKLEELFLAADSRISWTFNDSSRQVVHIDELASESLRSSQRAQTLV